MNHLDPTVKKGKLTLPEWKVLIEAHEKFGNKCVSPSAISLDSYPFLLIALDSFLILIQVVRHCRVAARSHPQYAQELLALQHARNRHSRVVW